MEKARVVRLLAVGVAIASFALLRPGPFRATITNPNALLRIAALVVALTGLSFLIRRVISNGATRSIIIAVPALVVLGVIVAPYFRNKTVIERLPVSAAELRASRLVIRPGSAPTGQRRSRPGGVAGSVTAERRTLARDRSPGLRRRRRLPVRRWRGVGPARRHRRGERAGLTACTSCRAPTAGNPIGASAWVG